MKSMGLMNKIKNIIKYNNTAYRIYYFLFNKILTLVNIFIKKEKIILFVSYGGKKYDDSPMVIYQYMKKSEAYQDYKKIWAFINPKEFIEIPDSEKISINSIKYFLISMRAQYWITNSSIQRGLNYKCKRNIYVNFQHGTLGIKKIGENINNQNQSFKSKRVEKFDHFIIQGKHEKEWVMNALQLEEKHIDLLGLPRNVELYNINKEKKQEYKQKLGIPLDKTVILYAPTFRETLLRNNRIDYIAPFNYEYLKEKLGNKFVFMLTNHYESNVNLEVDNKFLFNMFNYPHINDLIIAADIIITDYSSITFDAFIAEIPVLCYGYDYDDYFKHRGEPYLSLDKLFEFGVIREENQLISTLINMNYKDSVDFAKKQKEKYIYCNENCIKESIKLIFN